MDRKRVPDLLENPLVMFQHRWAGTLSVGSNFIVCVLIGLAVGDMLGAFVLAWWTRLFLSHHLTWFINSLAHCWGARTYSREQSAVDNYVLALLTVGEGYHNYHHTFPSDYRNGVRWYHFDPTKWTIWTLSKLGLAHDLERISPARIEMRLLREDRRLLGERLERLVRERRADLERRVEALSRSIQEKLGRKSALAERIRRLKRAREVSRQDLEALRNELRTLCRTLQEDWKAWHRLCSTVLDCPAVA